MNAGSWRATAPSPVVPGRHTPVAGADPSGRRRLVVGTGELAVSASPSDVLVTHALGSSVGVCIWDPTTLVAGLLHVVLPDSRMNPLRAEGQPTAFADTGIPLLFEAARGLGLQKNRCLVRLVGGAEVATAGASFDVGKRNILAAKNTLWRHGVLIRGEDVGGKAVRSVSLVAADGRLHIAVGHERAGRLEWGTER